MSVLAVEYVIERRGVRSGTKLVWLLVAERANEFGVGWPGIALLARRGCCSERVVGEHLRRLEELGELARFPRRRGNGSRTTDWLVLAPGRDRRPMLNADLATWPKRQPVPTAEVIAAATSSPDETSPDDSGRSHLTFSHKSPDDLGGTRSVIDPTEIRQHPPTPTACGGGGFTFPTRPPAPAGRRRRDHERHRNERRQYEDDAMRWAEKRDLGHLDVREIVGYGHDAIRHGATTDNEIVGYIDRQCNATARRGRERVAA